MPGLLIGRYNREAAIEYAHRWAFSRNPSYYNFDSLGGDCTNFTSQCIFTGTGIMNNTPVFGWYYNSVKDRAPAWTSVVYFYNFLTGNRGRGPFGKEVGMEEVQAGDVVQLQITEENFQHSPFVVSVGENPDPDNILVAAHTYDSDNRPLSSYPFKKIRFIHIDGFRF